MNQKIEQLKKILKAKKADALFLPWEDPSHYWILGKKLENSYILIQANGKPIMIKGTLEAFESDDYNIREIEKRAYLGTELAKFTFKRLCVDYHWFTMDKLVYFRKSRIMDISKELYYLRGIKSPEEISKIRIANEHTAKCFNLLIKTWKRKKFKSEGEIVKFVKLYALEHDLGLAFDTIVASGINACTPHHDSKGKINSGFCVIDMGFDYDGYKADMTRTLYIGKPAKEERQIYDRMLRIQKRAITMCYPGTKCADIYNDVNKALGKDAIFFTHGLGHGAGVEIHELPNLKPESMDVLAENNVVTIEPGIYDKKRKLGIRIEDSILVTSKKPIILTEKSTKELIVI